jgi:hypothetical protein
VKLLVTISIRAAADVEPFLASLAAGLRDV